ncbi:endolytic transglycosylase MltG [Rossellomorea aquimaris]|uniref:endolytic transglycosylase MltG n=1 Tax=Rossellomorea aquimaris TaxID=189382 RepID=UPI0007D04549|nr:endolytic transglycosylase MltG [Rossellomorea aquimaris]
MNKQSTRAFSSGILFVTVILLIGVQFIEIENPVKDGYIIVKEKDWKENKRQIKDLQNQIDTLNNQKQQESTKEKKEEKQAGEKFQLTLVIESGMTPEEIAKRLQQANIIQDEEAFVQYIVENDYANKIQIGEFLVHSQMTLEALASTITK